MSEQKTFKNKTVYIPELLKALNDTGPNQRAKRIEIIREYASKGTDHNALLRAFVECMFHPAVVFDLPPGTPPYKENTAPDYDSAGNSLFKFFSNRMVRYFVKGQEKFIQQDIKRQMIFIQTLEGLYKDEAKVLLMIKEKQLEGYKKFVSEDLFREALPGWLPEAPKGQLANG
jgi:hypothetical protein